MNETLQSFIQRSLHQRFTQETVCDYKGDLFKVNYVSVSDDWGEMEVYLCDRQPDQKGYLPPWEPRCRSFRQYDSLPEIVNMEWKDDEKRWVPKEDKK